MRIIKIFFLAATVLMSILYTGPAYASTVTITSGQVNMPGEETTVILTLDSAPSGLSGFMVNLTVDPEIARITSVTFPSWAVLKSSTGLGEGGNVRLKAVDLKKTVEAGAANVELATVTIRGVREGSTPISLSSDTFDDDLGQSISRSLTGGIFSVGSAQTSGQQVPEPVSAAQTTGPESSEQSPVMPTQTVASLSLTPIIGLCIGLFLILGLKRDL